MAKGAKEFSITRTRSSFKPRVNEDDIPFFDDGFGNVLVGLQGCRGVELTDNPPIEVRHMPYAHLNEQTGEATCTPIALASEADLPQGCKLDYQINGGFNNNCIIVTWDDSAEHRLEWVMMKTFTGSQMKYALRRNATAWFSPWPTRTRSCIATRNHASSADSAARMASCFTPDSRISAWSASRLSASACLASSATEALRRAPPITAHREK